MGHGIAVKDVRNRSGAEAVEPPGQARGRPGGVRG